MHAYAYANAIAMQLRTKHLKCYTPTPAAPIVKMPLFLP
jgi:hypothetical protein